MYSNIYNYYREHFGPSKMTKAQFKYLSNQGQVVVFKEGSNFTEYGRANLGKVWLLIDGDVRITVEKEEVCAE